MLQVNALGSIAPSALTSGWGVGNAARD